MFFPVEPQKRFLHDVLGFLRIAEKAQCKIEEGILVPAHDLVKSLEITILKTFDQLLIRDIFMFGPDAFLLIVKTE